MGPYGYWPMKACQGDGCTNKLSASSPALKCPSCIQKEQEIARGVFPDDPEGEQKHALYEDFRLLGFTEGEAHRLADAWADPTRVSWWLEQGCSHRRAVSIAT